jgi:hypothetical protein
MTITSTTSRVDYVGNGVTTAFAVPFAFFGASELTVIQRVIATGVETTLALSTHYTVSGGSGTTGTVTAVTAPASTVQWTILRSTARTQEVDYQSNDPFPAETHERALDRLTAIAQEVERDNSRALRVPATDPAVSLQIPPAAERAGRYQAYDATGAPVASVGTAGPPITPYAATLLDDTGPADARATLGVEAPYEDIASAATTNIGATSGQAVRITGTTTITSFGTAASGVRRVLRFAASLTLTHNASSLILPGGANIVTAADDRAEAVSLSGGNWLVTSYTPATAAGMRSLAGAAAAPTDAVGDGQWTSINPGVGNGITLISGGMVAWWFITCLSPGGTINLAQPITRGITPGGTTIQAGAANIFYIGMQWRR